MKIKYDEHGFIWEVMTDNTEVTPQIGYNFVIIQYSFLNAIVDTTYRIPNYRIVNSVVYPITDVTEYQSSTYIWNNYLIRLRAEIRDLILTKTDSELKVTYDASPDYFQRIMYNELEAVESEKMAQNTINLVTETTLKILLEVLYHRDVLGQPLDANLDATYKAMLTRYHNHNSIVQPFQDTTDFVTNAGWYNYYQELALNNVDQMRQSFIPRRYYICGK